MVLMAKAEIIKILAILKANYSNAFKDMTKQEAEAKINLWTSMFADVEPEEMLLAVQKIIATKPYFPTVAEVRSVLAEIKAERILDAGAAWEEVRAAIREYGRYQPEQAFQSMSPVTRLVAKRMGWIELCMSEEQSIDRAHFFKIYQTEESRQKENALLPLEMFEKLEQKQLEYRQQRQQTEQKFLEQKREQETLLKQELLAPLLPQRKEQDFVSVGELLKRQHEVFAGIKKAGDGV